MLWRFDVVVLAFILGGLLGGWRAHHVATVRRSLTLMGILALLTGALACRPWGMWALAVLIAGVALYEVRLAWHMSWLLLAVFVALGLAGAAASAPPGAVWTTGVMGVIVLACWALPRPWVLSRGFGGVLAFGTVGLGLGTWALMATHSLRAGLMFIWLLQLNDAFGYFGGRLWGRHHPVPSVSPGKTIEGYAAGVIGVGLGCVLAYHPLGLMAGRPVSVALALGGFAVVGGNIGDLTFSKVKRQRGIKDFSGLLPGHGGVLDRFDNVLVAAPGFLLLWQILGMGR
ncbi:MAG: phosphatidate cytidylyltransferase [Firmicutes bacterium]|nr:phosphatidate cytidylyltransferase [Bacillota bacterium]